ncbi:MAG: LssY C-terminal domain-containing protein [Deltaproteobacteria bacterium]|nr:LssY C-terminal domain-containing protein [Deltaproteobacteria bacterium]
MKGITFTSVLIWLFVFGCATYVPPQPRPFDFSSRAQTQESDGLRVSAVVLSAEESNQVFAAPMWKNAIQPIWLEMENQQDQEYILMLLSIDPNYFSPAEAAWKTRSMGERGFDEKTRYFLKRHIPVVFPPKSTSSGFVYTNFDPGGKAIGVDLIAEGRMKSFEFVLEVPGFQADYMKTNPEERYSPAEIQNLELEGLRRYLESLPSCVLGGDRKTPGDPLNLVIVGEGVHLLTTFVRQGWDLTETLRAASAWRTAMSSMTGSSYRTSPISPLYLFDRPQDVALQKARQTVDERNHLRLWRAPVNFEGTPVWLGQISRDIGVKLSSKTVVTHKIDPVVDEARLYMVLDLLSSRYLGKFGYTKGVGYASFEAPRYNYTDDPYVTDGLRLVLFLSKSPIAYEEIQWLNWEDPLLVRNRTQ